MNITVGKCNLCSGRVSIPEFWGGSTSPVPTCDNCGACAKADLPVIIMDKTSIVQRKQGE